MQKIKDIILFIFISVAFFALLASDFDSFQDDCSSLRKNLTYVSGEGAPGRLLVFGENSFPVLTGWNKTHQQVVVAASKYKSGRVISVAHESFLDSSKDSNLTFLKNCFSWCGAKDFNQSNIVANTSSLVRKQLKNFKVKAGEIGKVKHVDIWIVNSHKLESMQQVNALIEHVQQGGGLIVSGLGWAWKTYMSQGKSLKTEFLGNQLLNHFGMSFIDGVSKAKQKSEFVFDDIVPIHLHLNEQWSQLKKTVVLKHKLLTSELEAAIRGLPVGQGLKWMDEFCHYLEKESGVVGYDFKKPMKSSDVLHRLQILLELEQQKNCDPLQVKAHPSHKMFPGSVTKKDAKRIEAEIQFDPSQQGWVSTGLYAEAGQPLKVKVPPSLVGKVSCRLGAHSDKLFHLDTWKRMPEISSVTKLKQSETTLCTAYGGLVYLEFKKNLDLPEQSIIFQNVLQAPIFIAGKTSLKQWNESLKFAAAPWGEIGSDKIIVSVPSESLRSLDRPDQLMETWDKILDLCAELAQIPKDRSKPQRMVCDIQISAGYMHSGYPIMTWMDQKKNLVDRQNLLEGNWGFYHELGHNHQKKPWTFEGTGEVTCNLFSLYVFEKLCGIAPQTYKRTSGKIRDLRVKKYLQKPDFKLWKSNPWLALDMYVMLQKEFGWQPFKNIFSDYEDLPKTEHPKTDQERMDQWMVRFSNEVEMDLSPFFTSWGFSLSEKAVQAVSEYQPWNDDEVHQILN